MRIIFFCAIIFASPLGAWAQPTSPTIWSSWRSVQIRELTELENSTISSIYRKHDGEILIATAESLLAFDGKQVKEQQVEWATNDGYPLDRVLGFSSASDGADWVFTISDGIYVRPPDSEGFRRAGDITGWEVGDRVLAAINVQKPLGVLSLSRGRAYFFNFDTQASIRLNHTRDTAETTAIGTTPSGDIVLFDSEGWLTTYSWNVHGGWLAQGHMLCPLTEQPSGKVATLDGSRFFATSRKRRIISFEIDGSRCEQEKIARASQPNFLSTRVRDIWYLPKSKLLALATEDGLFIHSKDGTEILNTENSLLKSNQVTAVAEIAGDQLVVGSYLGLAGAFKDDITTITKLGNEALPEITAISSTSNSIFVSTFKGLYRIVEEHPNFLVSEVPLPGSNSAISILKRVGQKLFIGMTDGRVAGFDIASLKVECWADFGALQPITGFASNPTHARVYASALSGEIFELGICVDGKTVRTTKVASFAQPIIGLTNFGDQILLTDFYGVRSASRQALENSRRVKRADSLGFSSSHPGAWVTSGSKEEFVLGSPQGEILFKEGLFSNNPSRVRSIPETPYSIEIDELGRSWVASKKGIWIGDKDEDFKLAYRTEEMDSIAFEYDASHETSEGSLIFGGVGGAVIIHDPASLPRFKRGRISLQSATLGSRIIAAPTPLSEVEVIAPANGASLTFSFVVPFEIGRDFDGIETMLVPSDSVWTRHESRGAVEIGKLPPGSYTFRARGANAAGVWSENEIVIPITVLPPAWRSWWALSLYLVAAALTFLLLTRIYLRHLAREARLAQGEQLARAFSRLEDEWQEQREATDHLLRLIPATISGVIHLVRTIVASREIAASSSDSYKVSVPSVLASIDFRLQALQQQQDLCVFSTASQSCQAQQLVNELVASVSARTHYGSRYIFLDETAELTLPASLGQAVAIIMVELLELMVTREPAAGCVDPIISTRIERIGEDVRITVADSEAVRPSEALVDTALATTLLLLEDFGGSIDESGDFGYEVVIRLPDRATSASASLAPGVT